MWRAHSLEKTLMLGKIEGRRRRRWQRMMWLDGITDSMDVGFSKLQEIVKDREAWHAAVHGVMKSRTWLNSNKVVWRIEIQLTVSWQLMTNVSCCLWLLPAGLLSSMPSLVHLNPVEGSWWWWSAWRWQSQKGDEGEKSWEPRLYPGRKRYISLSSFSKSRSSKERSWVCALETRGQQKVSWDAPPTWLPFALTPQPAVTSEPGPTPWLPRLLVVWGRRRGSEQCCAEWRNDLWRKGERGSNDLIGQEAAQGRFNNCLWGSEGLLYRNQWPTAPLCSEHRPKGNDLTSHRSRCSG